MILLWIRIVHFGNAGDIEHRGVDYYLDKAFKLGMKPV